MCSVGDDIEDQENSKFMQGKPTISLIGKMCIKCRTKEPTVVLHSKYPYCKECFIAAIVHKFKALLGKHRVVRPDDNVLVSYRPGHPSTALLHFLRSGLDLATPKRIRFKPIVIYVENHYNLTMMQRKTIMKQIDEEVRRFGFQVYFISLTQYVLNPTQLNSLVQEDFTNIPVNMGDAAEIKGAIKKTCNLTIFQELLRIQERNLLLDVAKLLSCQAIFTSDLSNDVAAQLLTCVSLGRGAHAAYDIGVVDSRTDINIVRPLRSFTIKELALYNVLHSLEPVSFLATPQESRQSIQGLMEKFVDDLQINYPATVSTVVRTGDKLCPDKTLKHNNTCMLCQGPIESKSMNLSSAEATGFSHRVSTQPASAFSFLKKFEDDHAAKYCFACSRIANFL